MTDDYENAITQFPLFGGTTRTGARMLLEKGEVTELASGEMLLAEGGPPEFTAIVLAGKLEVFVERGGNDLVLNEVGPGTLLGELAVLCGQPRSSSVRAVERSAVLKLSPDAFRSLLLSDAFLSQRIFAQALRTLVDKERSLIDELVKSSKS